MNDQNINSSPGVPTTPVTPVPTLPTPKVNIITQISSKIPPKVKELFGKFYSNKKTFWPVSIVFVLLFLTILVGLLFGLRKGQIAIEKAPTPTPLVQDNLQQQTPGSNDSRLNDLKSQINNLDVNQKRLQPPSINFKVSF